MSDYSAVTPPQNFNNSSAFAAAVQRARQVIITFIKTDLIRFFSPVVAGCPNPSACHGAVVGICYFTANISRPFGIEIYLKSSPKV